MYHGNFYASFYVKVDKSTVHLVDEFNDCTEWPNRDGRFDLRSFPDGSYIKVEGSAGQASLSSSTPNSTSSQSRSYSQLFRYYNMIQLFEWLQGLGLACSGVYWVAKNDSVIDRISEIIIQYILRT